MKFIMTLVGVIISGLFVIYNPSLIPGIVFGLSLFLMGYKLNKQIPHTLAGMTGFVLLGFLIILLSNAQSYGCGIGIGIGLSFISVIELTVNVVKKYPEKFELQRLNEN